MLKTDIPDLSKIIFWTVDERWISVKDENSNQSMINSIFKETDAQIMEFEYTQ